MGQGFPATLSLRCGEKKLVVDECSKSCEKMCYCHCHYGIHPHSHPIHVPPSETHNTCLSSPLWGYSTFVVSTVVSPDGARAIAVLVFWNENSHKLFLVGIVEVSLSIYCRPHMILPFPIQRYLLSPDISRVHSCKALSELGTKNLPQWGFWCKESEEEPIKKAIDEKMSSRKGPDSFAAHVRDKTNMPMVLMD